MARAGPSGGAVLAQFAPICTAWQNHERVHQSPRTPNWGCEWLPQFGKGPSDHLVVFNPGRLHCYTADRWAADPSTPCFQAQIRTAKIEGFGLDEIFL